LHFSKLCPKIFYTLIVVEVTTEVKRGQDIVVGIIIIKRAVDLVEIIMSKVEIQMEIILDKMGDMVEAMVAQKGAGNRQRREVNKMVVRVMTDFLNLLGVYQISLCT